MFCENQMTRAWNALDATYVVDSAAE